MAKPKQRFGVRNEGGARSSEWVVMWSKKTSDVYLFTRTLGGIMKASFHQSGQCHVRAPGAEAWLGDGEAPGFLDMWRIDLTSSRVFAFSVMFPEQELRSAEWPDHKEKGTIWIQASAGQGVEVAIWLVRACGDLSGNLRDAGWHTHVADASLPDGRRLLVVAGDAALPSERLAELETAKAQARTILRRGTAPPRNPRLLLLTGANEQGTRKFVEAAVLE
jgi:hypothetical protein